MMQFCVHCILSFVAMKKISNLLNEGFTHQRQSASVNEYTDKIEEIVNEGRVGRATHQNQWRFPLNKAKNGVASDFSLKGAFGSKN